MRSRRRRLPEEPVGRITSGADVILLELAAQGVRGLAFPGGRATFRPGYNVVAAEGGAMRRLLEALLWPTPADAEAGPRASGGPGASVRAGLTVVGDDGVTYRLVRDLGGACQLHRFDAARRSFAPVAQGIDEVAAQLLGTVGVPERGHFGALLALSASDLPSKHAGAGLRAGAPAVAPRRPLTPAEVQRRVAELRGEMERSQLAEKLQYQLDGLQSRFFKAEETLKAGEKIREGLAAAQAALRELDAAAGVLDGLGDAEARLAAYEKAAARREEALARVEAEKSVLEAQGPAAPLWRVPLFLGGAGAGIAALAAAAAAGAAGRPALRWLALLDVPAFGAAAWAALRWVGALEASERSGRRRRLVDEHGRKTLEQYERDTAAVRAALEALGTESVADLRDALGRLADARSAEAEWRRRAEEWESLPENRSAARGRERLQAEIAEIEQKLTAQVGGYARDPRSIEAEIERLQADAAAPPPPLAPAPAEPAPGADPLKALLEGAGAALSTTAAGAVRAVQPRLAEVLAALSGQRLSGILADERGGLAVQVGGRPTPALSLPPADRDLCFLALKLAFLERGLAAARQVAVLEDAFAALPEPGRRAAGRILKQVARGGQVIHATADPVFREAADHSSS